MKAFHPSNPNTLPAQRLAHSSRGETVARALFLIMTHSFTGNEAWLTIPVSRLTWKDLPADKELQSKAIIILALRELPYSEYLQTEHWHEVRMMAIKRYLGQCVCGADANDVHHSNYDHKGFERPEDVIALCRPCHKRWHETWVLQAKASLCLN